MVDAPHAWENRKLDLMSWSKWIKRGLSLDWFRLNQIRMARKRVAEGGGESIECLMLQPSLRLQKEYLTKPNKLIK